MNVLASSLLISRCSLQDPVTKYRKDFSNPDENPEFDLDAWMQKHLAFSDPFVPKFVEGIKTEYGKEETKYACVGYW